MFQTLRTYLAQYGDLIIVICYLLEVISLHDAVNQHLYLILTTVG